MPCLLACLLTIWLLINQVGKTSMVPTTMESGRRRQSDAYIHSSGAPSPHLSVMDGVCTPPVEIYTQPLVQYWHGTQSGCTPDRMAFAKIVGGGGSWRVERIPIIGGTYSGTHIKNYQRIKWFQQMNHGHNLQLFLCLPHPSLYNRTNHTTYNSLPFSSVRYGVQSLFRLHAIFDVCTYRSTYIHTIVC
ncbi:hypothetical protein BDV29DRAFT_55495 [Aspergillus leporis]|uniref:Secreted protein n=1 Tax=Aspergillus leporis TaxID=41062 RepID=A0A5N5XFT3_9EURO|nr:hypothetical protein BDV29DRAFT_55495 [Aspergillus leporis]